MKLVKFIKLRIQQGFDSCVSRWALSFMQIEDVQGISQRTYDQEYPMRTAKANLKSTN